MTELARAPTAAHRLVAGVNKIAVLRANALGDFIVALPALQALRAAYPDAEMVLLATPMHAELLAHRPGPVDRVIVIPPGALGGSPLDTAEVESFFRGMRQEQLDLAIQLQGGGRESNPFVTRLGARLTAGLRTPDAAPLDRWVPYVYWQHEGLRFLEVASLVGAEPIALEPTLALTPSDLEQAERQLPLDGRPLVTLHPGATDPRRRWPAEKFALVGDTLAGAGARIAVTGGPSESELVGKTIDAMRAPAENLAGQLTLQALVGVLRRSTVVVSNDTGPRHLAAAVGTATVAIYWCGNLINAGPLTRARHRPLVSWQLHCDDCGANCMASEKRCPHNPSFVSTVPVEAVSEAALELLASETQD